MKHLTIIAILLTGALACTSQAPEPNSATDVDESEAVETGAPRASVPEGPPAACVDENDEPVQCEENSECCEGFECGYDPEGSTRLKTCIWAGG